MNRIITIGREFGSGGRELGRRLAEKLNVAYYDNEIIEEIAKRTDLSVAYVRGVSESKPIISFPIHYGRSFMTTVPSAFQQSIAIFKEQHKLLQELAEKSDCVIVGRCADYVLRDQNPFRIFVYADEEDRVKRCMQRAASGENLTENAMRKKIAEINKNRAKYYNFFSDRKWGEKENYDLLINTSGVEIKTVVDGLYEYLSKLFAEKND